MHHSVIERGVHHSVTERGAGLVAPGTPGLWRGRIQEHSAGESGKASEGPAELLQACGVLESLAAKVQLPCGREKGLKVRTAS